jgi:predicted ATPase/class 3 adenylate cyclase
LVSLVMSDIVDSTRRWNADESAMAADLEMHDGLIRGVVEAAGGTVFKHTGDGMIAVFDDPVAAVGAAAGLQQAIGSAQWRYPDGLRVRVAAHAGVVYPRDGDLFGTAVNKVARLLGVCPPDAVLVSAAVAGLLNERAPEGIGLRRVGSVALAGFASPDEVFAVVGPGLVEVSDLAGRGSAHPLRLPAVDEELIGRSDELAAIWDALGRARLVTLVGVGGMGKTRLALEVAAGAAVSFADGAWWIDLAAASSDDAVLAVALAAVGAHESPGRTPLESFTDRFEGLTGLVVVDNCEHVLRSARDLIEALRTRAPETRIVATSREALGLRGEQLVPVGSLPTVDGIELFVERARMARPDLDVDSNRPVIERICARLDGIPLAIELSAARCRAMTPAEIDARLDDRFRLLRGGRESAERHRTLQAAVGWSYSLLDPDERTVFDRMAVFAGGTLLDGLAAVTGLDEFDALDIVDRLISRSMVVATTTPLGTRYHQLETLRQYAEDRLLDAGSLGEVRDWHLSWAEALIAQLNEAAGLDAEAAAFSRFAAEIDNLRLAVAHAVASGRHAVVHEMVTRMRGFAQHTFALEVYDWAQPLVIEHGWTPATAACAALTVVGDFYRRRPVDLIETADDLPEWYEVAPPSERALYLGVQLQMGCPWRLGIELLDQCSATTVDERVDVLGVRLFARYVQQVSEQLTAAEEAAVVTEAEVLIDLCGRTRTQRMRAVGLFYVTWGLGGLRPQQSAELGNEACRIARHLGAERLVHNALAGVGYSLGLAEPSDELLHSIRQQVDDALRVNLIQPAGVLAMTVITPAIGRREPDLVARAYCIWKREFGRDHRRFLVRAGVPLPDDVSEFERQSAGVSIADLVRELLAALDRLLAERAGGGG